jgi:signal peptidase II
MTQGRKAVLVCVVLFATLGCDQATKRIAIETLKPPPNYLAAEKEVIGNFFMLKYAENTGAFLSLGSTLPDGARFWLLTVFTGAILAGLTVILWRNVHLEAYEVAAMALLLSGGTGNLIDRVFRDGTVVDFMILSLGSLRTGVFNVADVAVMAGIILLIGGKLIFGRKDGRSQDGAQDT